MAVTIDDFKRAFTGKLSTDLISQRDQQAVAALKLFSKAVDGIADDAAIATIFRKYLVGLVNRYDTLKKSTPPTEDLLNQLDDIRQQATLMASEVVTVNSDMGPDDDLQADNDLLPTTSMTAAPWSEPGLSIASPEKVATEIKVMERALRKNPEVTDLVAEIVEGHIMEGQGSPPIRTKPGSKPHSRVVLNHRELAKEVERQKATNKHLQEVLKNHPEWAEQARRLAAAAVHQEKVKKTKSETWKDVRDERIRKNLEKIYGRAPATGAETPTGGNTTTQSPASTVDTQLENEVSEYRAKVKEIEKKLDDLQRQEAKAKSAKHRAQLGEESKALRKEADSLLREAELLATRAAQFPAAGEHQGLKGKSALESARKSQKGSATVGGMGATLLTLATAYFVLQDIKYILEADSALEALERSVEVGGNYAAGAAEFAVIKVITGSNLATLGVQFLLSLDPRSGVDQKADELAAKKKAEEEQAKAVAREEHDAVCDFLIKHVPGVVEWLEDHYVIKNRKVYDETVKKVRQLRKQHQDAKEEAYRRAYGLGLADGKTGNRSKNKELTKFPELQQLPGGGAVTVADLFSVYERGFTIGGSRQCARDLGVKDARTRGKFVSNGEIKTWEAVTSGAMREEELFVEYRDAFNVQIKPRTKVMDRARELGYTDGKTGAKTHIDDIFKWPEVAQLIKDEANQPELWTELAQNYNDAFDIKTGKKDPYEGLNDD